MPRDVILSDRYNFWSLLFSCAKNKFVLNCCVQKVVDWNFCKPVNAFVLVRVLLSPVPCFLPDAGPDCKKTV